MVAEALTMTLRAPVTVLAGRVALPCRTGLTATSTTVCRGWQTTSLLTLIPEAICRAKGSSLDVPCDS